MAGFFAPAYLNPRFFAAIISLAVCDTTYSLLGCYSFLIERGLSVILGLEGAERLFQNVNTDL